MKVALIHYRLIHFGGLETRLKNYIDFFHNRGDEVTVICSKYESSVQLPKNVNLVILGAGICPKPFRQRGFDNRLKKYMQNHAFDFSLSLGRTSYQQYVLCPGNHLGYLQKQNKKYWGIKDREEIKMDKKAFRNSDMIFAASQMIKNELTDLYNVDENKIIVLYPPLNTFKYPAVTPNEKKNTREKLGWSEASQYFLFVSLGHQRKGLPLLLKLFSQLKNTNKHLMIIGVPEIKTDLSNVHYLGFFENPRDFYLAADALLHPSVYEPYGQIVAEAIQCQTPVIVSQNVGASEIVSPNEGLVLPPDDLNAWVKAVQFFMPDQFNIPADIAVIKKLTLHHHMQQMLHTARIDT